MRLFHRLVCFCFSIGLSKATFYVDAQSCAPYRAILEEECSRAFDMAIAVNPFSHGYGTRGSVFPQLGTLNAASMAYYNNVLQHGNGTWLMPDEKIPMNGRTGLFRKNEAIIFCDMGRLADREDDKWYDRKTTTLWNKDQKDGCTPNPLTPDHTPTSVVVLGSRIKQSIDTIQMCPDYLRLKAAANGAIDAPLWWSATVDRGPDLTAFLRTQNLDRSDLEFDFATSLLRAFLQTSRSGGATNNLPLIANTYVNTWVWGMTALPIAQRRRNAPNLALAARSAYLEKSGWVTQLVGGRIEMRPPLERPPPAYVGWQAPANWRDPSQPLPPYQEAPR